MIRKLLVVLTLVSIAAPCFAEIVDTAWVRRYDGPASSGDMAYSIAIDNSGNVYVTGHSEGIGTLEDYATVKYYPNGDTAWVRRYNGSEDSLDGAYAVAVDASGNVYVTGTCDGGISLPDEPREFIFGDYYATIKYDPDGDTAWLRTYNGPGDSLDFAFDMAVDGSGYVYVTGFSFGSGTLGDHATIKYLPNGDTAWVRRYNGAHDYMDVGKAIAVDESGNVYVTGTTDYHEVAEDLADYVTIKYYPDGDTAWIRRYNGPADDWDEPCLGCIAVDDSGNVSVTGPSPGIGTGSLDYATVKYDSDGDTVWVRRYNGPGNGWDCANAIAVDNSGNVYVTGDSRGTGFIHDYATIKYYSNGDTAWVRRYSAPGDSENVATSIALDSWGNVYVTGYSWNGADFDFATLKYDSSGNELWVETYNGSGNGDDVAWDIAVSASNAVYVTGESYGTTTDKDYVTIKYVTYPKDPNDPGAADTVYFQAGSPCSSDGDTLYFPQGGGDVTIHINIWNDEDIAAIGVPLTDSAYGPPSYAFLDSSKNNGAGDPLCFVGSRVEHFSVRTCNLTLNPPQVLLGAVSLELDSMPPGDGLFASMVFTVSGEGQICLDTLFFPPVNELSFVGHPEEIDFTPHFVSKCFYLRQGPLPVPDFVGSPVIGEKNLEVHFTDSSEGEVTSWYWSFGDGYFSTDQNPVHTYSQPGSYDVKLIATNQYGSDSLIKEDYVQVLAKPQADFTAEPTVGAPPLGVQFTDNSIGNVTSWKWYFGDDDSSSQEDPYHEYSSLGTYDVTLIATSANGSDTVTKESLIFAYPALSGDSVKVLSVTAFPNQEDVVVPIIQSNDYDSLARIKIPLEIAGDTSILGVDSVSFAGSRAAHFEQKVIDIDEGNATILIEISTDQSPYLQGGEGLLAKIYLKVKDVVPPSGVAFYRDPSDTVLFMSWDYALMEAGFSAGTLFVEKAESVPPETPQNLSASALESGISLTWTPVEEPDLRLYGIYRLSFKTPKTSVGFVSMVLDDTLATSPYPFYLDSDVSPGGSYFYWVSAVDSSWNESELSDQATASFGDTSAPVITLGPTVVAVTDSTGTIYWETDERADGCVELFEDAEWAPADSHTQFSEEHTITLDELTPSTSYQYRVRSDDSLDNGPTYSGTKYFTTASAPDITPPQIVSGPAAVYKTHNSAAIHWTTDEIADGRVYYGETTPFSDSAVDPGFATSHNIILTELSPGTEYFYVVTSEDPSGNGPVYSDTLTFTTEVEPDILPPVIVEGPIHSGITHNKAVISWLTDEISTSMVQYGTSHLYGSEKAESDFVQNHQIVLTNLKDSTLYQYRVGSVDPASNGPTWSSNFWFWTQPAPDTLSPIILAGPYASWVSNTMAQIAWTTDEISDSWVYYGLDLTYDNIAGSATYVREHSVVLTSLLPDTTYYYYISSTDPSGNSVESEHTGGGLRTLDTGEDRFATSASADVAAPVIISGPHVRYKTHDGAVVEWVTDESSNSSVEYGLSQDYGTLITYPEATINHTAFLSNLSPSTTYHFRVGSEDIANNGPTYSPDVTFTTSADVSDTEPPVITVPPEIAYADESRAIITWETDEPSDSYMGYELVGRLAEKVVGESMSMLSHQLTLNMESSYNVRVFSSDQFGNGPTYSEYFTVTALAAPDMTAPAVISGPEVVYVSENSAKIRWETDELSSSFVEYGLSDEYTEIEGNPDNDSLHEVTLANLSSSTTYHFRIKSADVFANTYLGSDSTFTTEASGDMTAPGTPTGFSASYGDGWIKLSWDENPEADLSGYSLQRGTALAKTGLAVIASNLPNRSYNDQGLVNGVAYYYQISAVDQNSNESPASEVICSKPLSYIVGDYNGDQTADIVDVVAMINYIFKGAEGREPLEAANVNCDEEVNITDVVYLINYVLKGGRDLCICTIPEEPLARHKEVTKAILGLSFPAPDQSREIEVLLEAEVEEEVAGVQIDLSFDPSQVLVKGISTTERTDKLGLYYHIESGKVKIGMLDIYGVHTLAPGAGPLLKIELQSKEKQAGIFSATIQEAIVVNTMAEELEVHIRPNKVTKSIPADFSLGQNYPNPFNARTVISYGLPRDSEVKITIYNVLGQRVKVLVDEYQSAGHKSVVWDGKNQKGKEVASGVYLYRIEVEDFTSAKKMLLLK